MFAQGDENEHGNVVSFVMRVKCEKGKGGGADGEQLVNSRVLSKDLVWVPQGDQVPLPSSAVKYTRQLGAMATVASVLLGDKLILAKKSFISHVGALKEML